ncbi:hypothetical protein BCL79_2155 [Stenotrophomonas rhizophila]|uniref:YcxB-like C-terminal domain-containing protein n=1 Tax=Stenotrophomonas rhizophila TaxID=216778 RepID=A0A498CVZ0_9GAMM|nr:MULTISPECIES: YcxB family protein [Stenotrophomonas]RLK57742.1 hypothetical protein BCL79_2155 [Stenotrophomonas rhizophila]
MEHPHSRIEIDVSYQLAEYRQLLHDVIAMDMATGNAQTHPANPWNWPIMQKVVLAIVVPPIFAWKMLRVGRCLFVLSAAGISRTSKGITASRTWDQVKRVQRLQAAYLIELLEGGAMPIPFREMDTEQRQQFEQLLTSIPVVILKPAR